MERSTDLRMQMKLKQQQSSTTSALSGKEKAKFLKEKKRRVELASAQQILQKPSSQQRPSAPTSSNLDKKDKVPHRPLKVLTASQLTKPAASSTQHSQQPQELQQKSINSFATDPQQLTGGVLGLDYDNSDAEEEKGKEEMEPLPSTTSGFQYQEPAAILHTLSRPEIITSGQSALPVGFFDDHTDDLEARGIDINAAALQLAKHEDNQLAALLDEVDAVESALQQPESSLSTSSGTLVEEYDRLLQQQETSESEMLNKAVQLAYEAKVIALMEKTDRLKKKRTRNQNDNHESGDGEGGQKYDHILETEVDSLLQLEGSEDPYEPPTSTAMNSFSAAASEDLSGTSTASASILEASMAKQQQRRKAERRRARASRSKEDEGAYVPLDFMNWTSKVI